MTHDQLASDAVDLLPCPFCGGEGEVRHLDGTVQRPAYYVECQNCGSETNADDRGNHVKNWNTRTSPPSTVHNDGWKPIATAPKDGTTILARWQDSLEKRPVMMTVFWEKGEWWDSCFEHDECAVGEPIHWMLPPSTTGASDV